MSTRGTKRDAGANEPTTAAGAGRAARDRLPCAPKGTAALRAGPLLLHADDPPIRGPMKRSHMGPRRALVLGLVHVAVVAHVTHWLLTKRTISPVEPSESMRTFELGELNAGFVFFVLAIVSTAIFGRFFCGWGCHVVALQDLCAWIMKRFGVKPRPFRSRLLLAAPAALAFYMFAWPTVKRVVAPLLGISTAPFPGFTNHLTTSSFWATFPGVAVAIPFLLVCGFAVVMLLGSKGFCTYGCPYGGIFAPLDRFAPGRIRVSDACNGCGHCTATCTSNVRVHEEVRTFKMVVDPGCMKCMDCVSVCPNDALSFGFAGPSRAAATRVAKATAASAAAASSAAPAPARRAARRWDLSWRGEAGVAAAFLAAFFAFRGVYGAVPLLMAVGIALCVMYLAWTAVRLARVPDVAIQKLELKRGGRLTRAGTLAIPALAAVFAVTLHSGAIQATRWNAERLDRGVTWTSADAFAGRFAPTDSEMRGLAARAAVSYRRADSIEGGGWGFFEVPEIPMRRAWVALVGGDLAEAERQLRRVIARRPREVGARDGLARVLLLDGRADEAIYEWNEAVLVAPTDPALHRGLADAYARSGRVDDAIRELVILTNLAPEDAAARQALEHLRASRGPK